VKLTNSSAFELLLENALWNTLARIERIGSPQRFDQFTYEVKGQATEKGLISFFMDMHNPKQCFTVQNSLEQSSVLERKPFDSDRKMATLAV